MTEILTRAACRAQLPADLDQLAIDLHLAATAGARHRSRVDAVSRALAATYPTASVDQLAAIAEMEIGGVGGVGGYRAGSEGHCGTVRMLFMRGLGKGRRHASDGDAWTSAVSAVDHRGGDAQLIASLADVLVDPIDQEYAIAYCLRGVSYATAEVVALHSARSSRPETADYIDCDAEWLARARDRVGDWARAARAIAARAEPDGPAGRLAARYGMDTLQQLWSHEMTLTDDTVAAMLGDLGWSAPAGGYVAGRREADGMTIDLVRPREAHIGDAADEWFPEPGWLVRISARGARSDAPIRRAWLARMGPSETEAIAACHVSLAGTTEAVAAHIREGWSLGDGEGEMTTATEAP